GAGNIFHRAAINRDAANAIGIVVDEINPLSVGRAAGVLVAVAGGELLQIRAIEIDAVDAASRGIFAVTSPGEDDAVRFGRVRTGRRRGGARFGRVEKRVGVAGEDGARFSVERKTDELIGFGNDDLFVAGPGEIRDVALLLED